MKIRVQVGLRCGCKHSHKDHDIDFNWTDNHRDQKEQFKNIILGDIPPIGLVGFYCSKHESVELVSRINIIELERDVPQFS